MNSISTALGALTPDLKVIPIMKRLVHYIQKDVKSGLSEWIRFLVAIVFSTLICHLPLENDVMLKPREENWTSPIITHMVH